MKNVEFWILETVVDEGDWDCSKVQVFRSYESMFDYICLKLYKAGTVPRLITSKDSDGYSRYLVYDIEDNQDPWYVIHKGSLCID